MLLQCPHRVISCRMLLLLEGSYVIWLRLNHLRPHRGIQLPLLQPVQQQLRRSVKLQKLLAIRLPPPLRPNLTVDEQHAACGRFCCAHRQISHKLYLSPGLIESPVQFDAPFSHIQRVGIRVLTRSKQIKSVQ